MNILNPKPRFGYEPVSGLIYDYVAQRDVQPTANYETVDGTWDLLAVREAIIAGVTIETAHLKLASKKAAPAPAGSVLASAEPKRLPGQALPPGVAGVGVAVPPDTQAEEPMKPPLQPAADWDVKEEEEAAHAARDAERQAAEAPAAVTGLSVAQLAALQLSGMQTAALALTRAQLTVTGVSAATVKSWGLTKERADALKLTAAQRAVLLPA